MSLARTIQKVIVGAILAGMVACAHETKEQKAKVDVGMPPEIAADFMQRVDAYVKLSKTLEAKLPKLPPNATPQQIDQDQRAFEQLVASARSGANPGDIFTLPMQAYIRDLLAEVFEGPLGAAERKAVHDEPHPVEPIINKRYPDEVPLATMPPKLLANLPTLPSQLEYRFVHNDLILLDVHAHMILDYVHGAMSPTPPPASTP